MCRALQDVVQRHESLRSCFNSDGSQVFILKSLHLNISIEDLSANTSEEQKKLIADFIVSEAHISFDLLNGPLFRSTLFKLAEDEHYLTLSSHHIVCDGWSLGIIMQDLSKLYSAYAKGRQITLEEAPRFSRYAIEQYDFYDSEEYANIEKYWFSQYQNSIPILSVPTDFPRPSMRTYRSAREDFEMEPGLINAIKNLGTQAGCSFVTTLLSLFKIYLHRLTNQDDIAVGLPTAGQSVTGNYGLVGHCVNLLPLRCAIEEEDNFSQFLNNQKRVTLDAFDHQRFTFGNLLQKLPITRDPSRIPLIPIVFNVDMGMDNGVLFEDLRHQYISNPRAFETFEIFVNASGSEKKMILEWSFNTQLFRLSTIRSMMDGFEDMIKKVSENPGIRLHDIKIKNVIASNTEHIKWNDTYSEYPKHKAVHDLVTDIARDHVKDVAVCFERKQITYQELDESANQLAAILIEKGVQIGDTIAVALERSEKIPTILLAIMKSGAIYVPLDPEFPKDRIEFMLQDSSPKILLASKKYKNTYKSEASEIVIEDIWPKLKYYSGKAPSVEVSGHHPVYILYTSGSTGRPKGVKIAHHNLVNFLLSLRKILSVSAKDRFLALTTLSFDISGLEIYLPLVTGASVTIIPSQTAKDGNLLLQTVKVLRPTIVQATPATWQIILEAGWNEETRIKTICCGGEAMTKDLAHKLNKRSENVFNLYGPTETTIWSTVKKISAGDEIVSIGHPIDNTQVYILDHDLTPVPPNSMGEIYIAGEGVAKGYLRRPELTRERFIDNPFSHNPDSKMYRTGDLGRILPNGEIECLGRIDQQLKIRGYRIEPAEIEHCLLQQNDIKSTVVISREDRPGDQRLVAYVVTRSEGNGSNTFTQKRNIPEPGKQFDGVDFKASPEQVQRWKQALRVCVPAYMIPSEFVVLKTLPLTPNGKVDRKALPAPAGSERLANKYVAPGTELESSLVDIWKKLLRTEQVGIHDNFFELGGHSLLAMRLITAMRTQLGVEIPLIDIFECTIQSLAEKIKSTQHFSGVLSLESKLINHETLTASEASMMGQGFEEAVLEWGLNGKGKYLVPIQKGGTKIPFIGIISFYSYHLLAKYLPKDQPLYYLPPTRSASVDVIAAHYVKEIKQLQPYGPYCIGGFCEGGNVAFEIAHQLEEAGDKVVALVLFEYYSQDAVISKKSFKYFKRRLSYYKRRFVYLRKTSRTPFGLMKLMVKNSYERFKDSYLEPAPPKFITSSEYKKYVYKAYAGKVILFQAGNPPLEVNDSPLMGWSEYFTGDANVITVDGGHLGIFREPAIQQTGEKLSAVLHEVNEELNSNSLFDTSSTNNPSMFVDSRQFEKVPRK
jgi:amino acid adenylation domain-containing protein